MKPVVQKEKTGCAIACSAAIAGVSYAEAKKIANGVGISAEDSDLWSETNYIRRLLATLGIPTSKNEMPFTSWESLPRCALLSIKWHSKNGKSFWHWVVFVRDGDREYVLDSGKSLQSNIRTDFGRMKPKFYIEVNAKK